MMELPLADGTVYKTPSWQIAQYRDDYPGVNVLQEFTKMRNWLEANPSRRKTERGIQRFIVNWLNKCKLPNEKRSLSKFFEKAPPIQKASQEEADPYIRELREMLGMRR